MNHQRRSRNEYLENIVNCLALVVALFVASWLRNQIMTDQVFGFEAGLSKSRWVLVPSILYFLIFSPLVLEETIRLKALGRFQVYILHFLGHVLLLSAMAFIFQEKTFSRLILLLFLVFSHLGFFANRIMFQTLITSSQTKMKTILFYNTQHHLQLIESLYRNHLNRSVDISKTELSQVDLDHLDLALFLLDQKGLDRVKNSLEQITDRGIRSHIYFSDLIDINESNPTAAVLMDQTQPPAYLASKRALDLLLAVPGLLVFFLLYVLVGPWIRWQTGGSILFRQTRVGQGGKPFMLYKFRTMKVEIEQQFEANEIDGPAFKMKNDPRVTSFGKWMRKVSLDEFPQFLNVLWGDMSVVGPRPPLPSETQQYQNSFYRRLRVKPGITGYWQVHSRRSTKAFDQILTDDLYYIQNAGLLLDLYIILLTPIVMLRQEGK